MHVEVKDLGASVRDALKAVEYGARDIEIVPASTVPLNSHASSEGSRGFVMAVNLETGERKSVLGQWGGSNMFVRSAVDETEEVYALPEHGVMIKGQMGYPRTFARIYVHPAQLSTMLPAPAEETSDEEQHALFCFTGIKGGAYRRDELARRRVKQATIDLLIERGYLSKNKAGAVQVTTKGKNARDRKRVPQY